MSSQTKSGYLKLLLFSIAVSIISYGYNLTNFFVSVDNELPAGKNSSMDLGRWGTNLFLYHFFNGVIPYYTLLVCLIFMSVAATGMAKLFNLKGYSQYIFSALLLSFPQMAYQYIFGMQSAAIGCGFMCSAFAVMAFKEALTESRKILSVIYFITAAILIMFVIACYQALVFIPIVIYIGILYMNTYKEDYSVKSEIKPALLFGVLLAAGGVLYMISVKVLCNNSNGGNFMKNYTEGTTDSRFVDFYNLWIDNLRGDMFYGDKPFVVTGLLAIVLLIITALKNRSKLIIRATIILLLLLVPFIISFFISNGAHPPRLYVASGISFGLITAIAALEINFKKLVLPAVSVIVLINIFFITRLFVSQNSIYLHDLNLAKRINDKIYQENPDFNQNRDYVYFYGKTAESEYDRFRLPNSEIFAGSIFQWDEGNNHRIVAFNSITDVAQYKMIDNKETFEKIKDSLQDIPVWPEKGSIKRIDNVIIVKLGAKKGAKLWVE